MLPKEKITFTSGKRMVATKQDCEAPWEGVLGGDRFRCMLCGHRFVPDDGYRWVCAAEYKMPNFFVCDKCDKGGNEALIAEVRKLREEFMSPKFWWFRTRLDRLVLS